MKLKILQGCNVMVGPSTVRALKAGDEVDTIPDNVASSLIKGGLALRLDEPKAKIKKVPKSPHQKRTAAKKA